MLTKLDLTFRDITAHVEFLPQLPHLTVLHLDCSKDGGWSTPADALLTSLLLCNGLTELNLTCGFKSAHWTALFAQLAVKKLTIGRGSVETLSCFAGGPITQTLEELTIESLDRGLKLPPSELLHLYNLRSLRTLHLNNCFFPRLSDDAIGRLSPPTALLPALTMFIYQWQRTHCLERKGPAYCKRD